MTATEIKQLVLTDIDKDKYIYRENSYRIKQYAYHAFNYIDENKKPIKERVFSFILMTGTSWDNSTHINLRESEVETVIERFKAIIAEKKAERKRRLTIERSLRKLYPRHLKWQFDNVTITIIENPCYYSNGYASPYGGYFSEDEKHYDIYANEMPFRYGTGRVPLDFEFTTQWVLENIANKVVARYNVDKLEVVAKRMPPRSVVVVEKFSHNFVPYHFYIGLTVSINGINYNVRNSNGKGFDTDKGDIKVPVTDLGKLAVIGELQGMEVFAALKNKYNYVE